MLPGAAVETDGGCTISSVPTVAILAGTDSQFGCISRQNHLRFGLRIPRGPLAEF